MLAGSCAVPSVLRAGGCLRKEDDEGQPKRRAEFPAELCNGTRNSSIRVALKENPDKARALAARHDQGDRHRPAAHRCPRNFGSAGVAVPVERPKPGMVRVLDHAGEGAEFSFTTVTDRIKRGQG